MPELTWIGKKAVIRHHAEVPFRLLEEVPELSCPPAEGDTENLIVQGDNLIALKALLPRYAGQVKCIYIDPPYNTGNEGWVYNDAVNSPEIRQWLGHAVGKEADDLSRHDKWLCLMYPRLVLLRQFLRDDGVIFASIDDFEFERLKLLMSEIFGQQNHVCTLIWKRRTAPDSRNLNGVSGDHEYVLCYGKTQSMRFRGAAKDLTKYSNPDNDPRGPWMSDNPTGLANPQERPNLHYDINYKPIAGFDDGMPYFCLRVPTGGGKTFVGAKCVPLVNRYLLQTEHSVILWLVPSNAIRSQTLNAFRNREHPYYAALAEAGPLTVLDLEDARGLTRATLDTSTVVIVATRQAFSQQEMDKLKVYESSGALQHHFSDLSPVQRANLLPGPENTVPYSFANVLRLRRPFVVVDEAHNARTELSFETLARFRPSGILELTATPDLKETPSNVLHSVSAAELKAEAMIKLPIVLETEPDWQKVIAYAIDKRNQLQILADQEQLAAKPDRDIGDLWEELSGGKCLFVMVKEKRWDWIEAKLRSV